MRLRVLALVGLLAGCASGGDAGVQHAPDVGTTFPVARSPRPVVVIGDLVQVVGGLRGEDKVDVLAGRLDFTGQHADAPPAAPVTLPDGAQATLPLIGSADALSALTRPRTTTTPSTPPSKLVAVEFGTAEFPTDRGPWTAPAWLFTTEAGSVLAWPAPEPGAFWRPGEVRPAVTTGEASTNDRELVVSMPSAPSPCPGDEPARNEAVVRESADTVTVGVRTVGHVGECARTLAVTTQPYRVRLADPLGGRLLVDQDGGVVAVTTR
ncbi:hypothetical protein AB0I60_35880 [Actinosynnema sp. NPDC050436]|uniref:hypothetical protein n=1 Tax=Actinosynnema sp. NPDC050436 TaxID=3155659 RepID=UPI0033F0AA8D